MTTTSRVLMLPVLLCVASSCRPEPEKADEVERIYFPAGIFSSDQRSDEIDRTEYSQQLIAFDEPSLLEPPFESKETYRFLFLPSWRPITVVRVEASPEEVWLEMKELPVSLSGEEPSTRFSTARRALTPDERSHVVTGVHTMGFWEMAVGEERPGMDGALWLLEGRKGDDYQAISRWNPSDGRFKTFCRLLLELAREDAPPQ